MKTLYLECSMGAAGDMLAAALSELCDRNAFIEKMNTIGLPDTVISAQTVSECGIQGTKMTVLLNCVEEKSFDADKHSHEKNDSEHEHHHNHDHESSHVHKHHLHTSISDIESIINSLDISEKVKKDAAAVYKILAEAESAAHGKPICDIHFHEVGTLDAIADIVGVCLLMEMISPEKIIASPINVGSGHIHCAHGILPVPAPATAFILRDIPMYSCNIKSELCTPTGAALLRYFVDKFEEMHIMKSEKIGYGFGKKKLERLNCIRAFIGEDQTYSDRILELKANIDDMTPEDIGFASEKLFDEGALDVFTIPIYMKKNRPAVLFTVLCHEEQREKMIYNIFKYTTTIGIRQSDCDRFMLERRESVCETEYGELHIKIASGYGIKRSKPEYDDIAKLAEKHGVSPLEIRSSYPQK